MAWTRFQVRLLGLTPAAEGQYVAEFRLQGPAPDASPGQFVQLSLPGVFWPRPFSLLDWEVRDGAAHFRILFAVVGEGTRALRSMSAGDLVEGHGPLGLGYPAIEGPTWMIAGGYGLAPLLFALRASAPGAQQSARIFYGAARADLLWRSPELDRFAATLTTMDGSAGRRGTVLDAVRAELDAGGARPVLYACGPMGLLEAVHHLAVERGLRAMVSIETPMPCGMGVCRGCAVPLAAAEATDEKRYVMACEDGPVMDSARVDWEQERACRI